MNTYLIRSNQVLSIAIRWTAVPVMMGLCLGLAQTAFSSGGGIVTDDPESLSSAARTEPYSPTRNVIFLISHYGVIPIYTPRSHLTLVRLARGCCHRTPIVLPRVRK